MPPPGSAIAAWLYPQQSSAITRYLRLNLVLPYVVQSMSVTYLFAKIKKENEYSQLLRHVKLAWN